MRVKVSENIYLSFHSSNIDGRGNWGSVWIEADDWSEGDAEAKVVLDDREDIRKLIKALSEAMDQIAVDSGSKEHSSAIEEAERLTAKMKQMMETK